MAQGAVARSNRSDRIVDGSRQEQSKGAAGDLPYGDSGIVQVLDGRAAVGLQLIGSTGAARAWVGA